MYGIFLMTLTRIDVRYFSNDINFSKVMYGIFLKTLTHSSDARYFSDDFNAQ
jgi:hypothetical protein